MVFSEDLECQRKFTLISNQSSSEEIIKERQKDTAENMNWIVKAVQYMENPTPPGESFEEYKNGYDGKRWWKYGIWN